MTTDGVRGRVAEYELIHAQILEMADMLSDGIIRQFPQAFGGSPT